MVCKRVEQDLCSTTNIQGTLKTGSKQTSCNSTTEKQPPTLLPSNTFKVINKDNIEHTEAMPFYSSKTEGCHTHRPAFNTLKLNGVVIKIKCEKGKNSVCMAIYVMVYASSMETKQRRKH